MPIPTLSIFILHFYSQFHKEVRYNFVILAASSGILWRCLLWNSKLRCWEPEAFRFTKAGGDSFRCVVVPGVASPSLSPPIRSGAGVEIQLVSRRMSVVMAGSLHRLMEKVEKPLGAGT